MGQEGLPENTEVKNLIFGFDKIAIICTNSIIITNNRLETISIIKENFNVISAFWNSEDLLLYTTKNHWKYTFINGENGLLKSL